MIYAHTERNAWAAETSKGTATPSAGHIAVPFFSQAAR